MPTICLDFDGVVHSYTSKWEGPEVILDGPVPGTKEFTDWALSTGYEVVILSVRSSTDDGLLAMGEWLEKFGFSDDIKLASDKPPAIIYVDDRGFRFEGKWDDVKAFLEGNPVPWNRK